MEGAMQLLLWAQADGALAQSKSDAKMMAFDMPKYPALHPNPAKHKGTPAGQNDEEAAFLWRKRDS